MKLRDRLNEIKGKKIRVQYLGACGIIIDKHGDWLIDEIGDDCVKLKNGDVFPMAAIIYIYGDI